MSIKKGIIAILTGTFIPPLAVLQLIVNDSDKLLDTAYWLGLAALTIGSFASAAMTVLAILAQQVGVPLPPQVSAPVAAAAGAAEAGSMDPARA